MDQAEQVAPLLKALADPVRLLSMMARHEGGEACICELNDAFQLSQPTISYLKHSVGADGDGDHLDHASRLELVPPHAHARGE